MLTSNNVYLGDSYELIKQIPDKSVDCIYTDIPYLYNQGSSGNSDLGQRTAKKRLEFMGMENNYLENQGKTRTEALRIAKKAAKKHLDIISIEDGINYDILKEFVRVMKKVNCFIWCSKLQIHDIMKFFLDDLKDKEIYFEILTWNKTNPTPTTSNSWLPDIEYCLYFREKGVSYNEGYELKSKWYIDKANKSDKDLFSHPTIKPLPLVQRHLLHTTKPNDIILDPFMGSGTTCVAAKINDRRYIGIEIVEKWYNIAKDRLEGITANGQTSFLIR